MLSLLPGSCLNFYNTINSGLIHVYKYTLLPLSPSPLIDIKSYSESKRIPASNH